MAKSSVYRAKRGTLVSVFSSLTLMVAMGSQPDLWLAGEPAHLALQVGQQKIYS